MGDIIMDEHRSQADMKRDYVAKRRAAEKIYEEIVVAAKLACEQAVTKARDDWMAEMTRH
jgi:hypothetical protein